MTAAPWLSLSLSLLLGRLSWLVRLLRLESPRIIWHHNAYVNISTFVVIRGA